MSRLKDGDRWYAKVADNGTVSVSNHRAGVGVILSVFQDRQRTPIEQCEVLLGQLEAMSGEVSRLRTQLLGEARKSPWGDVLDQEGEVA